MHLSRTLLALLVSAAATGSTAFAAPPGGIGAPPVGVPSAHVPVLNPPPLNPPAGVPEPRTVPRPNADASVHTDAKSSIVAGGVMHGTVTSVSGTTVTVELSNGTVQNYTVTAQTAARLKSYLNKMVVFRAERGAFSLAGEGTPPLRGTLQAVDGSTAQIQLANGSTRTYTVNAEQASWLHGHIGKSIAFWTQANGTIELNQSSRSEKPAKH